MAVIEPEIKIMTLHFQFACPECGEVVSAGFDSTEAYLRGSRHRYGYTPED